MVAYFCVFIIRSLPHPQHHCLAWFLHAGRALVVAKVLSRFYGHMRDSSCVVLWARDHNLKNTHVIFQLQLRSVDLFRSFGAVDSNNEFAPRQRNGFRFVDGVIRSPLSVTSWCAPPSCMRRVRRLGSLLPKYVRARACFLCDPA